MRLALPLLFLVSCALPAFSDDALPTTGPRGAIVRQLEDAQEKLIDLAKALPDDKYDWRPGAGVRSAGEVYRHVAQGNYLLPTFLGIKTPEGVTLKAMDTTPLDKAKSIALVEASFKHAFAAVAATSDAALADSVGFFGNPSTRLDILMTLATHAHEHLGQSIAYARSNGVVPPWTARAEAAAAAAASAKKKS